MQQSICDLIVSLYIAGKERDSRLQVMSKAMLYANTALVRLYDRAKAGSEDRKVARDGMAAIQRSLTSAHEMRRKSKKHLGGH